MPKALVIDTGAVAAWKAAEKTAGLSAKFAGVDLGDLLDKYQKAHKGVQDAVTASKVLRDAQANLSDRERYSNAEIAKSDRLHKAFLDSTVALGEALNRFSVGCTTYKKRIEAKKDTEKDKHKAVLTLIAFYIDQININAKVALKKMMKDEADAVAARKKAAEKFEEVEVA